MQEEDCGLFQIARMIMYVAVSGAGGQLCGANMVDVVHTDEIGLETRMSDDQGVHCCCSLTVSGCLLTVQFGRTLVDDATGVAPTRMVRKSKALNKGFIVKSLLRFLSVDFAVFLSSLHSSTTERYWAYIYSHIHTGLRHSSPNAALDDSRAVRFRTAIDTAYYKSYGA